ncbi:prolyl aminopeptidase [Labedaea rhizosphaerae]|uniref:Proline iminopeptidase n=1 Tax=Labedaea rhizosphaerae TaxID=598644 RepID=A0A4R6SAP9_LABRH|nr:prolyl aminopeptidase [Labedaea rhizosphaerae]TDP97109.1 proline iminopeptidase [Labedaea rhizosphaerae]
MALYPQSKPYEHGMLDVGDGHHLYYEVHGNPDGKPAVCLHGGPGSGAGRGAARFFDPERYRIVLFDQRNCGRSTPHASEPDVDLSTNTTDHLVADIERLREHLGVERWLVRGPSWGSVLALAYAQRHPQRVTEVILLGLATGRRVETELLTRGLGRLYRDAYARFAANVPGGADPADAYHRLLFDPDPQVRYNAAKAWCAWEIAMVPTADQPNPRYDDPRFRLCFARIVTHYWRAGCFLREDQLLRGAAKLAGIPGVLVQGELDPTNLVGSPWLLQQAWPGSELVLVRETGHDGSDALEDAVVAATDRFAGASGVRGHSG